MFYDIAKRRSVLELVSKRFEQFGFPLVIDRQIIPDEPSTLFVCSGMQRVKDRFQKQDKTKHGSLQSCVRTNDLELVGDGSHLTYFEMLGNFSFGGEDYELSVDLWDSIIKDLKIPVTYVTYHPYRLDHRDMWVGRGYKVVPEPECKWTDGNIGGYCCELFVGDLEIGNLVNPLEHSTDVGFGFERLVQILEKKAQVHQTSLFRQDLDPVVSDHIRTLLSMKENGVYPGGSGRRYVCRRLLQRVIKRESDFSKIPELQDWLNSEKGGWERRMKEGRRVWRKYKDRSHEFWWNTYGLTPEDLRLLG